MKIVNICYDDWANFMYQQHEALLSVGIESHAYKLSKHPFSYTNEATIITLDELKNIEADLFIIYHSDIELKPFVNGRVIYYHTGSKYRLNKIKIQKSVNDAELNLIALPEFHNTGLSNEIYLIGATPEPNGVQTVTNRFAHYPSNPEVKGTDLIIKTFNELSIPLATSLERVSYSEQLKRMANCFVYVELFAPLQGSMQYGSFGMTALEAASYRCVVITNNVTGQQLYKDTYGHCELEIANTLSELKTKIKYWNDNETTEKAERTFNWWQRNHSYKATGTRFAEILRGLLR